MHKVKKKYLVVCDHCNHAVEIDYCTQHAKAKEILRPLGWRFKDVEDICPECAREVTKGGERP